MIQQESRLKVADNSSLSVCREEGIFAWGVSICATPPSIMATPIEKRTEDAEIAPADNALPQRARVAPPVKKDAPIAIRVKKQKCW